MIGQTSHLWRHWPRGMGGLRMVVVLDLQNYDLMSASFGYCLLLNK